MQNRHIIDVQPRHRAAAAYANDIPHTFLEPVKLPQEYLIAYEVRNENAVCPVD